MIGGEDAAGGVVGHVQEREAVRGAVAGVAAVVFGPRGVIGEGVVGRDAVGSGAVELLVVAVVGAVAGGVGGGGDGGGGAGDGDGGGGLEQDWDV